jgi:hypothetical protein
MSDRIQLLLRSDLPPVNISQRWFDAEQTIEVRDLTTRSVMKVRAGEISCYLHTLFLDGKAYQILNVLKEAVGH